MRGWPLLYLGLFPVTIGKLANTTRVWVSALAAHAIAAGVALVLAEPEPWANGYGMVSLTASLWDEDFLRRAAAWFLVLTLQMLLLSLMSAWGARREKSTTSQMSAMHRVWLMSPLLPVLLLLGLVGERLSRSLVEVQDAWMFFWVIFLLAYGLLSVLRCIGAPRADELPPYPVVCDRCGYDLTAARNEQPEGVCPECELPLSVSLDPHNRPGSPWEQRRSIRSYFTTAGLAMFRPAALGRRLRAWDLENRSYRSYFKLNLLLLLPVHTVCFLMVSGLTPLLSRGFFLGAVDLIYPIGSACFFFLLLMLFLIVVGATVLGQTMGKSVGRNLMPLAMRGMVGLCPMVLLAGAATWGLIGLTEKLAWSEWFRVVGQMVGVTTDMLLAGMWLTVGLVFLFWFVGCAWRIVHAGRFANG